jgi:hypothetical protein
MSQVRGDGHVHVYDLNGAFTMTNLFHRHELPEPDENKLSKIYSEDRVRISNSIKVGLSPATYLTNLPMPST